MRVCGRVVSSWLVGEGCLGKGGAGQDCGVRVEQSEFREDFGAVVSALRTRAGEEASCQSRDMWILEVRCKMQVPFGRRGRLMVPMGRLLSRLRHSVVAQMVQIIISVRAVVQTSDMKLKTEVYMK